MVVVSKDTTNHNSKAKYNSSSSVILTIGFAKICALQIFARENYSWETTAIIKFLF